MPWQTWPPQQYQNQHAQGWRGYSYGTQPSQLSQQMYPQQYKYPQQPF